MILNKHMSVVQSLTTIEQSKRLLAAGVDACTADAYFHAETADDLLCGYYHPTFDSSNDKDDIPAWTLLGLLHLIPFGFSFVKFSNYDWRCVFMGTDNFGDSINDIDSAFELAVRMVIYCKEKGYKLNGE
jgi:hypothetical protein